MPDTVSVSVDAAPDAGAAGGGRPAIVSVSVDAARVSGGTRPAARLANVVVVAMALTLRSCSSRPPGRKRQYPPPCPRLAMEHVRGVLDSFSRRAHPRT